MLNVGEFVQARKVVATPDLEQPDNVAVSEFTVATVEGLATDGTLVVSGSPFGPLAQADGWAFEVIRGAPLVLPVEPAVIVAALTDGTTRTLKGKRGGVWMDDDTADLVDANLIRTFQEVSA